MNPHDKPDAREIWRKIAIWAVMLTVVAGLIYLWGKRDIQTYKRKFPNATTADWVWDVVNGR